MTYDEVQLGDYVERHLGSWDYQHNGYRGRVTKKADGHIWLDNIHEGHGGGGPQNYRFISRGVSKEDLKELV